MSADLATMTADELTAWAARIDAEDAADRARLERPEALALAALWYASMSIPVFPCEPRGKQPIVKGGLHAATTDREQITRWWVRTPAANIGLPTGHTFDVIDVDGPVGIQSYLDMVDDGLPFDVIGRVYTAGHGRHIYIAPTGDGNGAGIRPGIDFRGLGGYVIAPPSVGANGVRYSWLEPLVMA